MLSVCTKLGARICPRRACLRPIELPLHPAGRNMSLNVVWDEPHAPFSELTKRLPLFTIYLVARGVLCKHLVHTSRDPFICRHQATCWLPSCSWWLVAASLMAGHGMASCTETLGPTRTLICCRICPTSTRHCSRTLTGRHYEFTTWDITKPTRTRWTSCWKNGAVR